MPTPVQLHTCFNRLVKDQIDHINENAQRPELLDENGHRYVGLFNQVMTCYLNSLIQTLYMTPEWSLLMKAMETTNWKIFD
ncbi:hypothetical protein niasHS_006781 [Heterodera schachtii]|uniref:Peptidase C19 ubiquitin carboxyl-terminal hydrolase domain-containing protein n=1 Tax=Heterodera schachtii TaxID=97005 RepID=A0ABD2JI81_HETSC